MLRLAVSLHITQRENSRSTLDARDVQIIWCIVPSSNLGKSEKGLNHAVRICTQTCCCCTNSEYYTKSVADSRGTSGPLHELFLTMAPVIRKYSRTTATKSMYKSRVYSLASSIHTWRWITNNMDYSSVYTCESDGPSLFSYKANLYNYPFSLQTTWSHSCDLVQLSE